MPRKMPACIPHQALGFARQDGVAAQAEDEIGIAIGNNQHHQLGVGKVTITAQDDLGINNWGCPVCWRPQGAALGRWSID